MTLTQQLSTVARAFCDATARKPSAISSAIFNDGKRLDHIMTGGGDLLTRRFEYAMHWFSDNWPVGVRWPQGVSRPKTTRARVRANARGRG